jgi:regulatory protein
MTVVTSLQVNKNRNRVNVYVDGNLFLTVNKDVLIQTGIKKGQELTRKEIADLQQSDSFQRCFDAALDFLSYRPRSEFEVKQRLHKRGFETDTAAEVIARLRKNNILDDRAFALYWKNNRESYNPKGKSIIKNELLRKGISREIADEVIGDLDDEESAYSAGRKKSRTLKGKTYEEFRNRLYNYLKWRGFSYGIITRITERLWKEVEIISPQ